MHPGDVSGVMAPVRVVCGSSFLIIGLYHESLLLPRCYSRAFEDWTKAAASVSTVHDEGTQRPHRCVVSRLRSRHKLDYSLFQTFGQEHGALRPADIGRLTLVVHWIWSCARSVRRVRRALFRRVFGHFPPMHVCVFWCTAWRSKQKWSLQP